MDHKICAECGGKEFLEMGFGLDTCMSCGLCARGNILEFDQYCSTDRIMAQCTYTRRKRFRKYLMRANRHQSANTVPPETWEHLMKFAPFQNPGELHRCLKSAKHLKRKCYDSMPLMCSHLCVGVVPTLTSREIKQALQCFDVIDQSIHESGETMVSYLFCLEFILKRIGRGDLLPYVNRIKCAKRRQLYEERLSGIFAPKHDVRTMLLRHGKKPRAT